MSSSPPSESREVLEDVAIDHAWLGTSPSAWDQNIARQLEGQLHVDVMIRRDLVKETISEPYDPSPLLTLAFFDDHIGFSDIAAANVERALILIKAASSSSKKPRRYRKQSRAAISRRLLSSMPAIIDDEILALKKRAFLTIGSALFNCAAHKEALRYVKRGISAFPGDERLLGLRSELESIIRGVGEDIVDNMHRRGIIVPCAYPWLDRRLFERTPLMVREWNEQLNEPLEIRQATFSTKGHGATSCTSADEDVGALGIFAKRNITKGEKIMVDTTIISAMSIPSSTLEFCDACHAILCPPFVFRPECCNRVAFCSNECCEVAVNGYHRIICGHNFDWLFKEVNLDPTQDLTQKCRAVALLRVIAIILADNQRLPEEKKHHPLSHPLVARLTASYNDQPYAWNFTEDVKAPTKILLKLGIDIFADANFSQEVVQTILLRLQNNAHSKTVSVISDRPALRYLVNPMYIFLNHSCEFNVKWHGATYDVEECKDMNDKSMEPGRSAIWCFAARNISAGEECTISYIGEVMGDENNSRSTKRQTLAQWVGEGGCGCSVCEMENAENLEVDSE